MKILAFIDKEVASKYSNYRHLMDYCPDLPRVDHNVELGKALKDQHYVRESSFFNICWLEKYQPDVIITNISGKPHITEFEIGQVPSDEELESYETNYFIYKGGLSTIKGFHKESPGTLIIAYTDKMPSQFTQELLRDHGISHLIERPPVYEGIENVLRELRGLIK